MAKQPSLARVAVVPFQRDCDGDSVHMECQRYWHMLTPFRVVRATACRRRVSPLWKPCAFILPASTDYVNREPPQLGVDNPEKPAIIKKERALPVDG